MLEKFFKIFVAFCLMIFLGAPSCDDGSSAEQRNEEELKTARNLLRQDFIGEVLSQSELSAFEESAFQKLNDLDDYLKIISDPSLDSIIRLQAAEMILNLFTSGDDLLQIHPAINAKEIRLKDLIKRMLDNEVNLMTFRTDSHQVETYLHRTGRLEYTGKLSFTFHLQNDSVNRYPNSKRIIPYYLRKEDKIFGQDTLQIWNVRFSAISETSDQEPSPAGVL
jgi:hypothetical protein